MNIKFKKLQAPRLVGITNLVGHQIPERKTDDSSIVGHYCDSLGKSILGQNSNVTTGVDIKHLKLEIKSKDIHTNSDWTIGTMTMDDIINTRYVESSLYEKLQALWLIRYDNDLRIICNSDIHYFDCDLVQERIEVGYETARKSIIDYYNRTVQDRNNSIFVFEGDIQKPIRLDKSQQFKGTPGYRMEYSNSGNSIKFRISVTEMNTLVSIAAFSTSTQFSYA